MNIVMFNSGLNIHTCTWIVSLTTLLKCLLNYEIKICQNVAYHLTIKKPYDVHRTMFSATSFANAIKPKPCDGSNFKRWRELATLWLTATNVMYVTTGKAPEGVSEEKFNADDNLFRGAIISILVDNLGGYLSSEEDGEGYLGGS
jgi:hypothetical protein